MQQVSPDKKSEWAIRIAAESRRVAKPSSRLQFDMIHIACNTQTVQSQASRTISIWSSILIQCTCDIVNYLSLSVAF